MKVNKYVKFLLLVIAVLGVFFLLKNPGRFGSYVSRVDRTDHRAVAIHYVTKNGFIAKRIGKVERHSYFADGGGGGKTSFSVFRLYGEDKTGVCELTLHKNEKGEWFVTSALLTAEGTEYKIPIKRSGNRKLPKVL